LIDIIAHLCEMYRRSIPRDSWCQSQQYAMFGFALPSIYDPDLVYESS
jgi:hypothetical protein